MGCREPPPPHRRRPFDRPAGMMEVYSSSVALGCFRGSSSSSESAHRCADATPAPARAASGTADRRRSPFKGTKIAGGHTGGPKPTSPGRLASSVPLSPEEELRGRSGLGLVIGAEGSGLDRSSSPHRGLDIGREYGVADLDDDGEWVVGDLSRLEPN